MGFFPLLCRVIQRPANLSRRNSRTKNAGGHERRNMKLTNYSLIGLLFAATLFTSSSAQARGELALLNAHQVSSDSRIVDFRQTQFVFTAGRSLNTDWGQVNVDVTSVKLRRMLGSSGGY